MSHLGSLEQSAREAAAVRHILNEHHHPDTRGARRKRGPQLGLCQRRKTKVLTKPVGAACWKTRMMRIRSPSMSGMSIYLILARLHLHTLSNPGPTSVLLAPRPRSTAMSWSSYQVPSRSTAATAPPAPPWPVSSLPCARCPASCAAASACSSGSVRSGSWPATGQHSARYRPLHPILRHAHRCVASLLLLC